MQQVKEWFTVDIVERDNNRIFWEELEMIRFNSAKPHDFEEVIYRSDFEKYSSNGKPIIWGICLCPFCLGFYYKNGICYSGK